MTVPRAVRHLPQQRLPAHVPELPEVETIRRGLETELVGRRIVDVVHQDAVLRRPSPLPLEGLRGRTVASVARRGKFLLGGLDNGGTLLVHLGMSGKLLFHEARAPERPHTHLVLVLDDGRHLRYVDPRRFGMLRLYPPGVVPEDGAHHGRDALDPAWTAEALADLLASSRAPLKAFLLDQTKIAGVGNIYACEALWRARLGPRRRACDVRRRQAGELLAAVRGVLEDSLAQGGTSFNDYVDAIGRPGSFLLDVAVFRREGLACPRCGRPIRRLVQSGRSTFWCPGCQR